MLSVEDLYEILIDEDWYLRQYPNVRLAIAQGAWGTARDHFLHAGYKERHSPGPLFCTEYYCSQSSRYDPTDGVDPIHHYLSVGAKERASPHWLFSERFYRASFRDIQTAVDDGTLLSGYHHFLSTLTEHRRPHPLFCAVWLRDALAHNSDSRSEGAADHDDLFHHFICSAHHRGQSPGPLFDPEWYLACYDDVRRNVGPAKPMSSAVEHFLRHGIAEERSPLPDFDPAYYSARYPDVAEAVAAGLSPSAVHHWLFQGVRQNADPNRFFNSRYYLDANPHVADEIRQLDLLGAFEHFMLKGRQQGLRCNQPLARMQVSEDAGKIIFARRAQVAAGQLRAAAPLRFPEPDAAPSLSVVIPVKDHFDYTAQLLLQLQELGDASLEVVVVDDQSRDETRRLPEFVSGISYLRTEAPVGFPGAGNLGWRKARGKYVVFLNNDIELGRGALRHGLAALEADPAVGAVGGKIIRTDGRLQEAGSVLWNDGSCLGFGRDQDPSLPQFGSARDVDYCSACFLMVPRELLERLEGFDEAFRPGYYEDADLCFRIWAAGYRVVYDPRIYLYHFEYASFSRGRPPEAAHKLMAENRDRFRSKHLRSLAQQPAVHPAGASYVVDRGRRERPRVLLVEDMMPVPNYGSGFGRSHQVVRELLRQGCPVTVVALSRCSEAAVQEGGHHLAGVELLHLDEMPGGLDALIHSRRDLIDVLWVCRTHNGQRFRMLLETISTWSRRPRMVYDTEALATGRDHAFGSVMGDDRWTEDVFAQAVASELAAGEFFDTIVTVNAQERRLAQQALPDRDHRVLGYRLRSVPSEASFDARAGLLFVGAIHREDLPNYDSLLWFINDVWPLVRQELPHAEFRVAGYWRAGVRVPRELSAEGVTFLGPVESLAEQYAAARVFVAPTRYAAGIPLKVLEAVSYGVPTVATTLLAQQLGWEEGEGILAASSSDPAGFARKCVRLYTDAGLWREVAQKGGEAIATSCSPEQFEEGVRLTVGEG